MSYFKLQRSNPWKLGLASCGAGFFVTGVMQLLLLGAYAWPVVSTTLGFSGLVVGFALPGHWITKFVSPNNEPPRIAA